TGTVAEGSECSAEYWWDNIRKPVLFATAIERLIGDGFPVFLEIGPHPVLASYIAECASAHGQQSVVLPSLRRMEDDSATLRGSVGSLYAVGYPIDWTRLYPRGGSVIRLPAYPWQGERHWNEPAERQRFGGRAVHPLLGHRLES